MMNTRESYQKETGKPFEQTYSDIQRIEGWEGDDWEPSWAEWGYVNWLEAQNAKLVEALKEVINARGKQLPKAINAAESILSELGEDK